MFLRLDDLHLWKSDMLHYKWKRLQYKKYKINGDTLTSLRYAKFMQELAT